ncbi:MULTISPECIES: class I SAM-dependent methyltransferase [Peptoniphilus]|uniref:tRNA (adenine(22)-N(1))-methyltransferase n=1 Tax=Peptoniphilus TaxID=162289 RepID=UPI0001DA9BC2|nr:MULTISPECIES: class I SAM-dependent methyltransferase [Peptoniphilus]EFI42372.1 hypothetical protein HMPREF0629_01019 [Peptoniphilus sp. oral taxon 386 str. F0131]
MINISNRLKKISEYVDRNSKVADIGTDHGFVPAFLVSNNISDYVVCSDISFSSLKKSVELVKKLNYSDKIFPRLGSGLEVVEDGEVDTVIIAGMGGNLIVDLLHKEISKVKNLKKLILQPMQGQEFLRKYLYCTGYEILDENIVYEDEKFFEIIVVKYTGIRTEVNEIYYEIPKLMYERKENILKLFLENKIKYNKSIIKILKEGSNTDRVLNRISKLESKNKSYEELLWNMM